MKFFVDYTKEEISALTPEQTNTLMDAEMKYWESQPHHVHQIAVDGSLTQNGGVVKVANADPNVSLTIGGKHAACVGDYVEYPDGSHSRIISGAGTVLIDYGRGSSVAVSGSLLENGDVILADNTMPLDKTCIIRNFTSMPARDGFLVPHWMPTPTSIEQ